MRDDPERWTHYDQVAGHEKVYWSCSSTFHDTPASEPTPSEDALFAKILEGYVTRVESDARVAEAVRNNMMKILELNPNKSLVLPVVIKDWRGIEGTRPARDMKESTEWPGKPGPDNE